MNVNEEFDDHPIFKNDPVQLQNMTYSHVELTSCDGHVHTGRVLSIDPVSERYMFSLFQNTFIELHISVSDLF